MSVMRTPSLFARKRRPADQGSRVRCTINIKGKIAERLGSKDARPSPAKISGEKLRHLLRHFFEVTVVRCKPLVAL